jgi:hypothetical protein
MLGPLAPGECGVCLPACVRVCVCVHLANVVWSAASSCCRCVSAAPVVVVGMCVQADYTALLHSKQTTLDSFRVCALLVTWPSTRP